jgi:hypothetical protein
MGVLSITQANYPFKAESLADTANVLLKNVTCDASVYIGSFVYIEDITFIAKNARADAYSTSNVIGLCESKTTTTLCNIRVLGTSSELFIGLDVTREYFLSDAIAGGLTITAPTAHNHVMLKLGQPFTDKKFLVLKGSRVIRR